MLFEHTLKPLDMIKHILLLVVCETWWLVLLISLTLMPYSILHNNILNEKYKDGPCSLMQQITSKYFKIYWMKKKEKKIFSAKLRLYLSKTKREKIQKLYSSLLITRIKSLLKLVANHFFIFFWLFHYIICTHINFIAVDCHSWSFITSMLKVWKKYTSSYRAKYVTWHFLYPILNMWPVAFHLRSKVPAMYI